MSFYNSIELVELYTRSIFARRNPTLKVMYDKLSMKIIEAIEHWNGRRFQGLPLPLLPLLPLLPYPVRP